MGTAATARVKAGAIRARAVAPAFRSSDELREVLDRALTEVDADERIGPLLRAAGLRIRFRFTDLNAVLEVAASDEDGHHLAWRFDAETEPKLELRMASGVANAYLQGRESLAVAIARGRVRCKGDARATLLYVPAVRLLAEPYRRVVREHYPHLALD
jgi:hypothetical protein